MVRDGDSRHPPLVGPLYQVLALGDAVHVGHLGVEMELHALFLVVVLPHLHERGDRHDARGGRDRDLVFEGIHLGVALDLYKAAGGEPLHRPVGLLRRREDLDRDGVREVGQDKLQDGLVVADVASFVGLDLAADRDKADLADNVGDRNELALHVLAADDVRIGGADKAAKVLFVSKL